jgi:long-subunit fatty acid transport protein
VVDTGKSSSPEMNIFTKVGIGLSAVGLAESVSAAEEVFSEGKAIKRAVKAAKESHIDELENALIGMGFSKESVYEELQGKVNEWFRLAYRSAVEHSLKAYREECVTIDSE